MNDKKKKSQLPLKTDHKLVSRRDFLGHGLIAGAGMIMAPSLLMALSRRAMGADCVAPSMANLTDMKTPVIIFDLGGGANIPGSNVMVGGMGGQEDYLSSYTTLGLPPDMAPSRPGQVNNELGLLFHADSGFLRGIQNVTDMNLRSRVEGGIFCTSSSDDTANNPHNPMYWLNAAGAEGQLAQLVGTKNSMSGGKSMAPAASMNPALKPVTINSPNDTLSLVSVGKLGEIFNEEKAQRIMQSIQRLSESRLNQLSTQTLPEQIKTLVNCGYIQSKDLINQFSADVLDPSNDNLVTQVFNLNDRDERKTASIAKLIFDGFAGVGTIEKGGYDYHNKTRATGEIRDFDAGELIGKVMQLAALKQKDVLIYVLTDGGVAATAEIDDSNDGRGKYVWSGDSGQRSSAFMLLYRHEGRATLRSPGKRQIGAFKNSGGVETGAMLTSNSVTNLAKAVVANYLALHGEEANLANVVGDNPFGANLEDYLLFQRIKT